MEPKKSPPAASHAQKSKAPSPKVVPIHGAARPSLPPPNEKGQGLTKPLYELTDMGNAQRLLAWYGDALRYVPEWRGYLVYDGTYWRRDVDNVRTLGRALLVARALRDEAKQATTSGLRKLLQKWADKSENAPKVQAMVQLAKGLPGIVLDYRQLDTNPFYIQCTNGVLDLHSGKLLPPDPTYYITRSSHIKYSAEAKCPTWMKFLDRVLPEENVRGFMQRLCGYAITGDVSERVLVVMYGRGRNGKSIFVRMLQEILGDYAKTVSPDILMAKRGEAHPEAIADLYGARLAVSSEARKGRVFDEEAAKRLTGDDIISARRMRENRWTFIPTHKLFIAANHLPHVHDSTDSFWDRIIILPFTERIGDHEVDRGLLRKLRAEREGILAWAVEGTRQWIAEGLKIPDAVRAASKEYRREEDVVGRFVEDCCVLDTTLKVSSADLGTAVSAWCKEQGLFRFQEKQLADRLLELGCIQHRTKKYRGWRGIGLIAAVESGAVTKQAFAPVVSNNLKTARTSDPN